MSSKLCDELLELDADTEKFLKQMYEKIWFQPGVIIDLETARQSRT